MCYEFPYFSLKCMRSRMHMLFQSGEGFRINRIAFLSWEESTKTVCNHVTLFHTWATRLQGSSRVLSSHTQLTLWEQ